MPGGANNFQQQFTEYGFAQQLIFQQLVIFCREHEEANRLKVQSLQLQEVANKQEKLKRELFWGEIGYVVGGFRTVFTLLMIGFVIGIFVGINIPDGAGCTNGNIVCKYLRLRLPKVELKF
ncbi:MAG: hypothetical protein AAFR77_01480 [Cyanobacteria bacterium J06631_2]